MTQAIGEQPGTVRNQPASGSGAGQTFGPVLEIRDLEVEFALRGGGKRVAVDGASLAVYPGQAVAVVGESGCGKSVTALSTLRLLPSPPARIRAGHIWLAARGHAGQSGGGARRDLTALSEREIRSVRGGDIAMIFQEPMTSLNPVLTIGEQIGEAVMLHREATPEQAWKEAARALGEVGISEPERRLSQYPHEYSGGMRQRVMIAMALACRPRLLIADEPTTALDVTVQAQILELLGGLRREKGLAILLITHALGIVAEHADVVCVMYAGRVVEYATVFDLFKRPTHPYTRALLACAPRKSERVERLSTVRETVGASAAPVSITGVNETGGTIIPWWPEHARPNGVAARGGARQDEYALVEVHPGHWVGCWRTADASALASRAPDLPFIRPVKQGHPAHASADAPSVRDVQGVREGGESCAS